MTEINLSVGNLFLTNVGSNKLEFRDLTDGLGELVFVSGAFPVQPKNFATKSYVDASIAGVVINTAVCYASGGDNFDLNLDLESGDPIDVDKILNVGDLILLKDQADLKENGVYIVSLYGAPIRVPASQVALDQFIMVQEGATESGKVYVSNGTAGGYTGTNNEPVYNVDNITFGPVDIWPVAPFGGTWGTGGGGGSVTKVVAGFGLTGGTITTQGTIALGTTGVTAGTYGSGTNFPQIVVDSRGRITSATTIALGSIASQNSNNVSITGGTITGLPSPTAPSDAATKQYVDNAITGLSMKQAVRVATTAGLSATYNNGTSGVGATLTRSIGISAISIDGVSLSVGDRVLIKDQSNTFQNGIYSVTTSGGFFTAWVLTRTDDFDNASEVAEGDFVIVEEGNTNAETLWIETGPGPFVIGTTPILWSPLNIAPQNLTLLGDVTGTGAGTVNTSLSLTGVTAGTYTAATIVVDAKGRISSASSNTIGTGSVTSIVAGAGLTGGTITTNGTISLGTTGVIAGTYQGLVVNALGQITSASNQNYGTGSVTNIATGTGLVGGPISGSGTVAMGTSGVTAGTYGNGSNTVQISVDALGRILSATNVPLTTTGFTWIVVPGTTQALATNTGYITTNAGTTTLTLPTTAAPGDIIAVSGASLGLWNIAQNTGQTVHFGYVDTTTGTAGNLAATYKYDYIELLCIVANTDFIVKASIGNINVT